jgi:hypothetical protein
VIAIWHYISSHAVFCNPNWTGRMQLWLQYGTTFLQMHILQPS